MFEGNAASPELLAAANLAAARRLFVTVPDAFEAGQVVEQARRRIRHWRFSRAPIPMPPSSICRDWAPRW